MAKINNTFSFVGEFASALDKDKNKVGVREIGKSAWKGKVFEFVIKANGQQQRVKMFGGHAGDKIEVNSKQKDDKGKTIKLEIPFSKRFEQSVIDSVSPYSITKVGDKQFISMEDAIDYIGMNISEFEGKKFKVTGKVKTETYTSKTGESVIAIKFEAQNLFNIRETDVEGFNGQMAMFITSETLNREKTLEDMVNDKKVVLDVHFEEYNSDKNTKEDVPILYYPYSVVVNISDKFDIKNKLHTDKLNMIIDTFKVDGEDVYEMGYGVRFFNGAESKPITLDELTDFEKRKIELGYETLESISKSKEGMSEFKNEIQVKMEFNPKYTNGTEKTDINKSTLSVIVEKTDNTPKEEVKKEVVTEDSDLF
jgi:hypothetical protein